MTSAPSSALDSFTFSEDDLQYLAEVPSLLIAVDFDGTLAEFTDQPETARPIPGTMEALHKLAALPDTRVIILSGRDVPQLSVVTGIPINRTPSENEILLVGSHGAEPAIADPVVLTEEQKSLLSLLSEKAEAHAAADEGIWVEYKPYAVGLHTRTALDFSIAEEEATAFHEWAQAQEGTTITWGQDILEVAVINATKGSYLEDAKKELDVDAVFFAGDDITDETAQRILDQGDFLEGRPDLGIKVGFAATDASRRVADIQGMRDILVSLAEARSAAKN